MNKSIVEKEWQAHGLDCAVVLMNIGHRCGYVRVPDGHPWHGIEYHAEVPGPSAEIGDKRIGEDCGVLDALIASHDPEDWSRRLEAHVNVHGGLTYSGRAPGAVRPAGWWIGFDCAHLHDTPTEWTEERVASEVERLAEQVTRRAAA